MFAYFRVPHPFAEVERKDWQDIFIDSPDHLLKNSYLRTYNLYGPVHNAFDAGKSITWASGRGLGPGNRDFSGPCEMASSCHGSANRGPKKSRFQGPTPSHLPKKWICPHQNHYVHGRINERSIGNFMNISFQGQVQ
jgi:hypothetical protein